MRASVTMATARRCCVQLRQQRACFSSTAAPLSASLAQSLQGMTKRPAKTIADSLGPMPSHLLSTTLNDLIPESSLAPLTSTPYRAKPAPHLPEGHHLVYFPIQARPSQLVPDGTDPDHSPGAPFNRRMWAGGEVHFHKGWKDAFKLDSRPVLCVEDVADARAVGKEGEEKIFVDVRRRYLQADEDTNKEIGEDVITERRTLVFMRDPVPTPASATGAPPRIIKPPNAPDFSVTPTPSAIHLFNFSALTYNAHAIHLDREYTRMTDGHRSLLVHGPLTLALMLRVLAACAGSVATISYRNLAPLYVDEPLTVCVRSTGRKENGTGDVWDAWVERADGGLSVKATAVVA